MKKYLKTFDFGRTIALLSLTSSFAVLVYFMLGVSYDKNPSFNYILEWYCLPLTFLASLLFVILVDLTAGVGRESPLINIK